MNFTEKCLEKYSKQAASVLMFTLKSQVRQICSKNTKRLEELIQFSPCANKQQNELQKCYLGFIDSLMGIKDAPDHREKIPLACW